MSVVQSGNNDKLKLAFDKSFAGHETFAFRFAWLKKGIDKLSDDPGLFQKDSAIVTLGVGKNMVRSIRHWCLATRIVAEDDSARNRQLVPTTFGKSLLHDDGWDPYLEDDASLWLLHWNLASHSTRAATWYWAFNRFLEYAFTRQGMTDALRAYTDSLGWSDVSISTLKRDVDCFVHTYLSRGQDAARTDDVVECPLASLGILVQEPDGDRLRFQVGPKPTLPPAAFAYSLADFWNTRCVQRKTLDYRQIADWEGSPRHVYKLDEDSVLDYLDQLETVTQGAMFFRDDSQVRRVVKKSTAPLDCLSILELYYGRE